MPSALQKAWNTGIINEKYILSNQHSCNTTPPRQSTSIIDFNTTTCISTVYTLKINTELPPNEKLSILVLKNPINYPGCKLVIHDLVSMPKKPKLWTRITEKDNKN